jgi:hypothetical protein
MPPSLRDLFQLLGSQRDAVTRLGSDLAANNGIVNLFGDFFWIPKAIVKVLLELAWTQLHHTSANFGYGMGRRKVSYSCEVRAYLSIITAYRVADMRSSPSLCTLPSLR